MSGTNGGIIGQSAALCKVGCPLLLKRMEELAGSCLPVKKFMLLNFSNHPASKWGQEQLTAAREWGEVIDFPFPAVDPHVTEEGIAKMAEYFVERIVALHPNAVMCQGEMTLVYAVVSRLKELKVPCVAACSERMVEETNDGQKLVKFVFTQFRRY